MFYEELDEYILHKLVRVEVSKHEHPKDSLLVPAYLVLGGNIRSLLPQQAAFV
jgi:hypothetical protein